MKVLTQGLSLGNSVQLLTGIYLSTERLPHQSLCCKQSNEGFSGPCWAGLTWMESRLCSPSLLPPPHSVLKIFMALFVPVTLYLSHSTVPWGIVLSRSFRLTKALTWRVGGGESQLPPPWIAGHCLLQVSDSHWGWGWRGGLFRTFCLGSSFRNPTSSHTLMTPVPFLCSSSLFQGIILHPSHIFQSSQTLAISSRLLKIFTWRYRWELPIKGTTIHVHEEEAEPFSWDVVTASPRPNTCSGTNTQCPLPTPPPGSPALTAATSDTLWEPLGPVGLSAVRSQWLWLEVCDSLLCCHFVHAIGL